MDRFETFTGSILELNRYLQKLKDIEMKPFGLRANHVMCLYYLGKHPEGLSVTEMAETCKEDKAAVSRALAEMERKGLISRACPGDTAYRAQIHLTEAGERAAAFVSGRATVAVELAGKGLSDGDRRIFYAALDLIAANLQTISAEGLSKEAPGSAIIKETEL